MEELKKLPKKATEESFNELHYLVTEDGMGYARRAKRSSRRQRNSNRFRN